MIEFYTYIFKISLQAPSQATSQIPPQISSQLPYSLQVFSLIVSLIVTALGIYSFFRKSKLDVRLTKDIILRITGFGEAIIVNPILISHYGNVLIKKVIITLNKTDNSTKNYLLDLKQFGEKVLSENKIIAPNCFYSSSQLAFIEKDKPQRLVYFSVQKPYSETISNAFRDVDLQTFQIYIRLSQALDNSLNKEERQRILGEEYLHLQSIIKDQTSRIMENVQIEGGKYKLNIEVEYEPKAAFILIKRIKKAHSSIQFQINNDIRDFLKVQTHQCLQTISNNIMDNQTQPVLYPEYIPLEIEETN